VKNLLKVFGTWLP